MADKEPEKEEKKQAALDEGDIKLLQTYVRTPAWHALRDAQRPAQPAPHCMLTLNRLTYRSAIVMHP